MIHKKWVPFTVCLVVAFSFFTETLTAQNRQSSSSTNVVKVGYFYDGDYMYKTEDNTYRGYDVEYLFELARFTGWKYQFIEYETFNEECAALEKGEIDIIPAFYYSEERAKKFLFSFSDMGKVYNTLIMRSDDAIISYNDFDEINGMKVGVLEGTLDTEQFITWCQQKNLKPQIIRVETNTKLMGDLDKGVFDAVATSFMGVNGKYRIVAEFASLPMYFAVTKHNPIVMDALNTAMIDLDINNPDYQSTIYKKYFIGTNSNAPVFTKHEQDFIKNSNVLRVALQPDNPPYSYADRKGKMCGAIVDLLAKITELSGLKFSYVPASSAVNEMEMVMQGDADIAGKCFNDSIFASQYNVLLTNSYLNLTLTQITKKDVKEVKRIALTKFVEPSFSMFRNNFPEDYSISFYTASKQCFEALNKNEVDAAVIGSAGANYYINVNRASNYAINSLNGYGYEIALGVNRTADTALRSIINRCIHQSGSNIMNDFILKHSTLNNDSFHAFINKIPMGVALILILILVTLVIFLVIIVVLYYSHNRQKDALRLAQKETQMKTDFMGTMSHDMRTPLNAVLGYADLATNTNDLLVKNNYLGKIKQSGNLLLSLVNSALLLSKIENKRFDLTLEPVDFHTLIDEIESSIKEVADKKKITFSVSFINDHFKYVTVDKLNLQKIILNLLTNAVNYTNEGGTVELVCEKLHKPLNGSNAKFIVRDTGVGINKSFMTKMYQPFAQEKSAGYSGKTGVGLGLSIVKNLVDQMHGAIEVKSEVGKGTEFTVYLPLTESDPSVVNKMKAASTAGFAGVSITDISPEKRVDSAFSGKRVLLCEDNEMNREIAVTLLAEKGLVVDAAVDGKEGVVKFEASPEHTYDAVLMDIRMPEMDGYTATKTIRSLSRADAKRVPIIAMTADAYDEDKEKCFKAGMNAHVSKPIDSEMLFQTLLETMTAKSNFQDM